MILIWSFQNINMSENIVSGVGYTSSIPAYIYTKLQFKMFSFCLGYYQLYMLMYKFYQIWNMSELLFIKTMMIVFTYW